MTYQLSNYEALISFNNCMYSEMFQWLNKLIKLPFCLFIRKSLSLLFFRRTCVNFTHKSRLKWQLVCHYAPQLFCSLTWIRWKGNCQSNHIDELLMYSSKESASSSAAEWCGGETRWCFLAVSCWNNNASDSAMSPSSELNRAANSGKTTVCLSC